MSAFPRLKTLAVMQYPAEKKIGCSTRVLRFVDGSEQRFRELERPVRRWAVRLDLLDGREWAELEAFFVFTNGRAGIFSFTDPWDESEHADCSFDSDSARIELVGEQHARLTLL